MFYKQKWVEQYLTKLEEEIFNKYKNEKINTLYIGGGTPSCLELPSLEKLLKILSNIKLQDKGEYTIEFNPEDLVEEKIKLISKYNINRVSIGVQTFNSRHLKTLNRKTDYEFLAKGIELLNKYGIDNISLDLMYGFNGQTKDELKDDLIKFTSLKIKHISTYSLILESNTSLFINDYKEIDPDLESDFYFMIINFLEEKGFNQYELSNFSKKGYESKHNLIYWNNENYYGFGLSAASYIEDERIVNTSSINSYFEGKTVREVEKLNRDDIIKYHLMLGFRKTKGININEFEKKYNINILSINNIEKLVEEGRLKISEGYIYIPREYLYLSNDILVELI